MPLVKCAHCGDETFTVAGWADLDHCANCGRPPGGALASGNGTAQSDVGPPSSAPTDPAAASAAQHG